MNGCLRERDRLMEELRAKGLFGWLGRITGAFVVSVDWSVTYWQEEVTSMVSSGRCPFHEGSYYCIRKNVKATASYHFVICQQSLIESLITWCCYAWKYYWPHIATSIFCNRSDYFRCPLLSRYSFVILYNLATCTSCTSVQISFMLGFFVRIPDCYLLFKPCPVLLCWNWIIYPES